MTVPVSGEDQPDPRREVLSDALWRAMTAVGGAEIPSVQGLIEALDAADRAAGIRRVTEDYRRVLKWAAWDDGYEAARTGQQPHNPHRSAAPVPVQEDRP